MKFKHLNMLPKEKDEFSSLYWRFGQLFKYHLLRAGHNMLFPTWLPLTNASSSPFCPTGDTVCGCHQLRCADFHSKATAVKNFSPFRSGVFYFWLLLWRAESFWRVLIQKMSVQPRASQETQTVPSTLNSTQ